MDKENKIEIGEDVEDIQMDQGEDVEDIKMEQLDPIEELIKVNEDLNDKYVRLYAEYENYKKRFSSQIRDIKIQTKHSIVGGLLDISDDIMISREVSNIDDRESWIKGSLLIYDKIDLYLKSIGIEEVLCERGELFDSDKHDCISVVDAGEDNINKVIDITKRGYIIDGKIVKYPQVVVGK